MKNIYIYFFLAEDNYRLCCLELLCHPHKQQVAQFFRCHCTTAEEEGAERDTWCFMVALSIFFGIYVCFCVFVSAHVLCCCRALLTPFCCSHPSRVVAGSQSYIQVLCFRKQRSFNWCHSSALLLFTISFQNEIENFKNTCMKTAWWKPSDCRLSQRPSPVFSTVIKPPLQFSSHRIGWDSCCFSHRTPPRPRCVSSCYRPSTSACFLEIWPDSRLCLWQFEPYVPRPAIGTLSLCALHSPSGTLCFY